MSIPVKRNLVALPALAGLLILLFIISCALGRYPLKIDTIFRLVLERLIGWDSELSHGSAAVVLFRIRLPRISAAMLVGAALSASGAAYQGLFCNPLVSPDVLGVSAASAFGAAAAIFFGLSAPWITLSSFIVGLGAAFLVALISRGSALRGTLLLVLSGIMIASLFTSGTSFLKLVADPNNVLPAISYWLMGSLSSVQLRDAAFAAPPILVALILLYLLRWRINILTLGDEEAHTLGVNIRWTRVITILAATIATAASVAISGMIGWVGLVIPHFSRLLVGSDYRRLLPCSILMGAAYLLLVDNIARMATTAEIPLGILTSFVGVPFFLYLLRREGYWR